MIILSVCDPERVPLNCEVGYWGTSISVDELQHLPDKNGTTRSSKEMNYFPLNGINNTQYWVGYFIMGQRV